MSEKCREIGVGRLVIDDEAGIDRKTRFALLHVDGMSVATDAIGGLIDGDGVRAVEKPGTG